MRARTDDSGFDGRRFGAAAGATVAALILLGMVLLVAMSNRARDAALERERHAYDVTLLVRTVDATLARSESALGRFVLDEDVRVSGNIYANEWRLAGTQIRQLERLVRRDPDAVASGSRQVATLYQQRGGQLAQAAQAASSGQGQGGLALFYTLSKGHRGTGPRASRQARRDRLVRTRGASQQHGADAVLLRPGRPADRLSVLARRAWSGWRRSGSASSRCRRCGRIISPGAKPTRWNRRWRCGRRNCPPPTRRCGPKPKSARAAEAQLRQIQKMEAVGQLTGGIAHDFNNMLAVVVGGIDLARRRLGGPKREVMQHLNNAMDGATRAAALTRRLLSFARSEPLLPERVLAVRPGQRPDRPPRPDAGRADHRPGRYARRMADLRRSPPARKCAAQPCGQRARRDGGRGRHHHRHQRHRARPTARSATCRRAIMCGWRWPTPAAA